MGLLRLHQQNSWLKSEERKGAGKLLERGIRFRMCHCSRTPPPPEASLPHLMDSSSANGPSCAEMASVGSYGCQNSPWKKEECGPFSQED